MKVKPIWISSEEHMKQFSEIISSSKLSKKVFGGYSMPNDFPRVNLYYFIEIPIVYFTNGELIFKEDCLEYSAIKSRFGFLKSYSKVRDEISFKLDYSNIKSINSYQHPNSFIQYYNIKWIRIECVKEILNGNFLICVGGMGPSMKGIINNTEELYNILKEKYKEHAK